VGAADAACTLLASWLYPGLPGSNPELPDRPTVHLDRTGTNPDSPAQKASSGTSISALSMPSATARWAESSGSAWRAKKPAAATLPW